jgi:hypothetical protein
MEELEGRYVEGMHRQLVHSAADAGMCVVVGTVVVIVVIVDVVA